MHVLPAVCIRESRWSMSQLRWRAGAPPHPAGRHARPSAGLDRARLQPTRLRSGPSGLSGLERVEDEQDRGTPGRPLHELSCERQALLRRAGVSLPILISDDNPPSSGVFNGRKSAAAVTSGNQRSRPRRPSSFGRPDRSMPSCRTRTAFLDVVVRVVMLDLRACSLSTFRLLSYLPDVMPRGSALL
jgi:hypothetical protein